MTDEARKYIDLLHQKISLLKAMRSRTEGFSFSADIAADPLEGETMDASVENYIHLYDVREEILDEIKGLDVYLNSPAFLKTLADEEFRQEAQSLQAQVREEATRILTLDEGMRKNGKALMDYIRQNLKKAKMGKTMSSAYQNQAHVGDGLYFDSRN